MKNLHQLLSGGMVLSASLSLFAEEAIIELKDFTVVATRSHRPADELPASVSTLTRSSIDFLQMQDADDLLIYEPLVDIPFDAGGGDAFVPYQAIGFSQYSIRGLGGNRVLVEVDGIRQPQQFEINGGTNGDLFDPAVFESLEILKGSASSLYGSDALAGIVSFTTSSVHPHRVPNGFSGRLTTNWNSANDGFHGLVESRWGGDIVSGTVLYSGRESSETANNAEVPPNPASVQSGHGLATAAASLGSWDFALVAEHYDREAFSDLNSAEGFQAQLGGTVTLATHQSKQTRWRTSAEARWRPDDQRRFEMVRARVYVQNVEAEKRTRQVIRQGSGFISRDRTDNIRNATRLNGGELFAETTFDGLGEHRVVAGLSGSWSDDENALQRDDENIDPSLRNLIAMAPSKTQRLAAFVQDEWRLGRWEVIAGVRLEDYRIEPEANGAYADRLQALLGPTAEVPRPEDYTTDSAAPSVTVSFQPADEWITYARYARGFRQPSSEEYTGLFVHGTEFIQLPNPGLKEETSDSWEIGVRFNGAWLRILGAVFYTAFENFIETVETGEELVAGPFTRYEVTRTENVGEVEIYGYEVSSTWLLAEMITGLPPLFLVLNSGQAFGENQTTGDYLDSVSPFRAIASLEYGEPGDDFRAALTMTYRHDHDHVPSTARFVPEASVVMDLAVAWQPWDFLILRGAVRNLTDERYNLWTSANNAIHENEPLDQAIARTTMPGIHFTLGGAVKW